MKYKLTVSCAVLAAVLVLPATASHATDESTSPGKVYTMDNSVAGNNVLIFNRATDGVLSLAGAVATGGKGTGTGLGSQSALILSANRQWLFACNAGSDEISVFAVTPSGLVLTDKVSTEGKQPISLTLRCNLLYVLNAGGAEGDKDNVTGFIFADGQLTHFAGSTRSLSADNTGPAQVSFSADGGNLIVTEKATGIIDIYTVDDDGSLDQHKTFPSPVPTPFGFAVGRNDRIFVSEANGGAAEASSVSSYEISDSGDLTSISAAVPTTESAACWVVLTRNQRFIYTSNTGSGTISGYFVNDEGQLFLLNPGGVTGNTGTGSHPIDLALSKDSGFLYSLNSGTGTISAFGVNSNGALQPLPGVGGIPSGATGLAAY